MSSRYTRQDIEELFAQLCKEMYVIYSDGRTYPHPVGSLFLEHNATYGGYRVLKSTSEQGAVQTVTGTRYKPTQFAEQISFALAILRQGQQPYK